MLTNSHLIVRAFMLMFGFVLAMLFLSLFFAFAPKLYQIIVVGVAMFLGGWHVTYIILRDREKEKLEKERYAQGPSLMEAIENLRAATKEVKK